jgi:hypothetical protein
VYQFLDCLLFGLALRELIDSPLGVSLRCKLTTFRTSNNLEGQRPRVSPSRTEQLANSRRRAGSEPNNNVVRTDKRVAPKASARSSRTSQMVCKLSFHCRHAVAMLSLANKRFNCMGQVCDRQRHKVKILRKIRESSCIGKRRQLSPILWVKVTNASPEA